MTKTVNAEFDSSGFGLEKLAKDLLEKSPEVRGKNRDFLVDFLAEQALHGTDLHKAYPEAFQALIADASLREAFADLIDSVEQERTGELPELPAPHEIDLGFLKGSHGRLVEQIGTGNWKVLLRRTAEELLNLYKSPELAFRSLGNVTDEDWIPLLRQDVDLNKQTSVVFILEIAHTSNPNELGLFTSIALNPSADSADQDYLYDIQVRWGEYEGSAKMGDTYRVPLPPIPVITVENNLDQDLVVNLHIETVD